MLLCSWIAWFLLGESPVHTHTQCGRGAMIYFRLGVVLVSAMDVEQEVSVVLTRGFYYIAEHHSGRQALDWLLQVCCVPGFLYVGNQLK